VSRMTSNSLFRGDGIDVIVNRTSAGNLVVNGQITAFAGSPQQIRWIAPKGPHRCMSFSGSGLPYHDAEQAFQGTENKGIINSPDGNFVLEMVTLPSAYYTGLGSTYVPPVLLLEVKKLGVINDNDTNTFKTHVFLSEGIPNRWIAGSPPNSRLAPAVNEIGRAMYYSGREDLPFFKNQEMLCRAKGYPSNETAYALSTHSQISPWENTPSPA